MQIVDMSRAVAQVAIATLLAASACATRPVPPAPFTTVTLERTACFGPCPVYRVSVTGNGDVRFDGIRYVDSVGTFTGRLDARSISALRQAFDDSQYWTYADRYVRETCSPFAFDLPTIRTSITTPERSKHIDHDLGCGTAAPPRLPELYRRIDEIAGTSRWIGRR